MRPGRRITARRDIKIMPKNKKSKYSEIDIMRHSTAHILAHAAKNLWPGTKLGIGPVIENGFYYDIDTKSPVNDDDLPKLETENFTSIFDWKAEDTKVVGYKNFDRIKFDIAV